MVVAAVFVSSSWLDTLTLAAAVMFNRLLVETMLKRSVDPDYDFDLVQNY